MGYITIKPDREKDFYVIIDTITDLPFTFGTAESLLRGAVAEQFKPKYKKQNIFVEKYWERLEAADKYESSSRFRESWEEDFTIHYGGYGYIYRSQLEKVARLLCEKDWDESHPEVLALVTKHEE